MRKIFVLLVALSGVAMLACSESTNSNTTNTAVMNSNTTATRSPAQTAAALSSNDREFVNEAATGGAAEVDLGRLAVQKAQNADVKRFGQRMVDDHSKAGEELKQVASRKGITLPVEPTAAQKADKDKLSKLSGANFDREYMKMMVEDHDKDVKAFENQARAGQDADIKSFAAKTLPTLKDHQRMAHEIKDKLK